MVRGAMRDAPMCETSVPGAGICPPRWVTRERRYLQFVPPLPDLFRLIVRSLAAQGPSRVHQPLSLNELMDAVVPYRLVRRELGVDTSEDYETLLLRLAAGEGDFLQAEPATRDAFSAELAKPLPDLALLRVYGDTHLLLRPDPLRETLAEDPAHRYAPPELRIVAHPSEPVAAPAPEPEPEMEPEPEPEPEPPGAPDHAEAARGEPDDSRLPVRCPFCGGLLPQRLAVNFCPHCGMGQDIGTCRACGADMDVGWRFCVVCGEETRGGPA